jgi:hypothetical protein
MKKAIIVISIVLMHFAVYSQMDSTSKTKYIKAYNTIYTLRAQSLPTELMPNIFAFGKITKKENYNELQITLPNVNNNKTADYNYFNTRLTISFEHGGKVLKSLKSEKWNTYLGLRVSNYAYYYKDEFKDSLKFDTEQFYNTTELTLVPKVEYNFNKRIYMDFSLPLSIVNFNFEQRNIQDPSLSVEDRHKKVSTFNILQLRSTPWVGIGLRI